MKILLLTYFLIFCFSVYTQQRKYKLEIFEKSEGQKNVVKSSKTINFTDTAQLMHELEELKNSAFVNGHLNFYIDSVYTDSLITTVYCVKGEKLTWGNIVPVDLDEMVLRKKNINLKKLQNKPFTQNSILSIYEKIITFYENNGYPFASVSMQNIKINNSQVNAGLVVQKYNLFYFDSLLILGPANFNIKLLRKYLNIKHNEIYNESKLKSITGIINDLEFLEQGKPYELEFTGNKANIYTYLKNRKANRFNGIVGILPDENNKVSFTGEVDLALVNSFKRAENISLNWRKLESNSQDFSLNFNYPYLFYSPFGIESGFSLYKKDTSFINTGLGFGIRYLLYGNNYVSLNFQSKSTRLIGRNSDLSGNNLLAGSSSNLIGVGYYFRKFDDKYNPTRGAGIYFDVKTGKKKFSDSSKGSVNKSEISLKASLYFPVISNFVINIRNNSGIIIDDDLYENELYRLGGMNNFRGVDENSVLASRFSVFNLEAKYLFEERSNIYIFTDLAYFQNVTVKSSEKPISFGVGLNLGTRSGIFTINYALAKRFNNPFDIKTGKVHIGYSNQF